MSSQNSQTHQKRVEAGKKGAAARWGHDYDGEDNEDDNQEEEDNSNQSRGGNRSGGNRGGNKNQGGRRSSGGTPQSGKGRNQGQSGPRPSQNDEDDVREEDLREDEGAEMGDFAPGKNKTRQAVGRRIAAETPYEEFAERGRKGGLANRGSGAKFDYDDIDSYLDNPEMGVPDKNPNRVRGGKQAAQKLGHEFYSEIGHMGGQTRAGQPRLTNVDMGESPDDSFTARDAKDQSRQQGGFKAVAKLGYDHYHRIGQMGQRARQNKSGGNTGRRGNGTNEEENDDFEGEESYQGKNPNRVEGGRKAAQTRRQHGTQNSRNSSGQFTSQDDNDDNEDNEDMDDENEDDDYGGKDPRRVEAGRKAAETRRQHGTQNTGGRRGNQGRNSSGQFQSNNNEDEDEDMGGDENEDDYGGKDPRRVEAGRKAAETRRQHGTQPDHDFFSRIGKMGAEARFGRSSVSGKRGRSDQEEEGNNRRQYAARSA